MFRSYLAAAFRSLARGRLYAAISIFGLSLGICVALLMALILRSEYSYDRFIQDYDRTWLAVSTLIPQQRAPDYNPWSHSALASRLLLRFREVEATTRLAFAQIELRKGDVRAKEDIYWADPNFFDVLRMPAIAGDPAAAMRRPDVIVLPRSIARKYFGRDTPIGESLRVGGEHVMTVGAVIEDLPVRGTQLRTGIFASGLASWSELTRLDSDPANALSPDKEGFAVSVRTYIRLAPGAGIDSLQAAMPELMESVWTRRPPGLRVTLTLLRLDEVHVFHGFNPGAHGRLAMSIAIGLVVLIVACINFINLSTARASRRAREVMVRKTAGAGRRALIVQFLGEALVHVILATCIALALAELVLPYVNAFVNSGATLNFTSDPSLLAWIALGTILLSAIAGAWPALVLSSFRPTQVMKGVVAQSRGAGVARQIFVTVQFTVLIALIVAAIVVYQQRVFATRDALRVATDQHLMIRTSCNAAFRSELQALPGVAGVGCTSRSLLDGASFASVRLKNGTETTLGFVSVDPGMLENFGLRPLAGRFFGAAEAHSQARVVINETAVRRLGLASPAAAIGLALPVEAGQGGSAPTVDGEIIGVVQDFALHSIEREIGPTVYSVPTERLATLMDVKLTGRQIPETLAAVERLWKGTGATEPVDYFFLDDYIQDLYLSVLRFAQVFGGMACFAVLLACLGLVGLSASVTDRRKKEIGVRKAMGAGTVSILTLLVWQFAKPILWAALIALPLSAWLMSRWLSGFAYHVDLTPWPFLAAAVLALLVAMLTVSSHSFTVARSKPVDALRYE
jgi:putative ABC transport system permease protein